MSRMPDNRPKKRWKLCFSATGFLTLCILVQPIAAESTARGRAQNEPVPPPFAIGLVIGGAVGNALDRLQHGHVVDFIHYQIPNLISNVSNLADHAIVCGVLLVIAESFWRDFRDRRRNHADAD